MVFFHGHPAATAADKFHRGQFIFAYMGLIHTWGAAEAALFFISAGIAQMSRLVGNRTAVFACIGHIHTPFIERV
jgi:hypothetical protein